MANVMSIDGKSSVIVNPNLNIEMGLFLTAEYQGRQFEIRRVLGFEHEGKISSGILQFNSEDRRETEDRLNYILVMTDFDEVYRATGVSSFPTFTGEKPSFYRMGDDLEIKMSESAKQGIKSVRKLPDILDQLMSQDAPEYIKDICNPN